MKWAILGGGGVFGCHLAQHLLSTSTADAVLSIGRNPWPERPWTDGLRPGVRFRHEQVHIVHEPERLQRLLDRERPDVIVNFAALAYATSWTDAALYYQTNVMALARLAEWLEGKLWLRWFVQIGTSEIYGSTDAPAAENAPLRPTSPYAVSKMAADMHLMTLVDRGFPAVIVRPSNCYGEGQQLYRIVPRAAWCAITGHRMPLNGGGGAVKSFMHAEDLARAIVTVAGKGAVGAVYNAGPDAPISMRDLVWTVASLAGVALDELVEDAPPRAGEDARYWLDSAKLRALGWAPTVDFAEGARRMLGWARRYMRDLPEPSDFVLRS